MNNKLKPLFFVFFVFVITSILNGKITAQNPNLGNEVSTPKGFLKLPSIFSNNMVFQREKPLVVWGKSSPKTKINIFIDNQEKAVLSDINGQWKVSLNPLKVGGPYKLTISTSDTTITYSNILSGDVWMCSGQSNMEFQLQKEMYVKEELPNSKISNLRMIRMLRNVSSDSTNQETSSPRWLISDTLSAKLFSAIGYYFGKKLYSETNVPIGLIGNYWGGSTIESWMSVDALKEFPVFAKQLDEIYTGKVTIDQLKQRTNDENTRRTEALKNKLNPNTIPYTPYIIQHVPSLVYNGMIAPLTNFPIKGIIWYQGEANVSRAEQYSYLFPALIKDWRKKWNDVNLPFYFVQLPNYGLVREYPYTSQWAELRESQQKALVLPQTGMVVTTDLGTCDNLHPINKKDVGNRLAGIALNNLYGLKNIAYKFPQLKSYEVKGNSIICEFENVGNGLIAVGGDVTEFCIAGANKRFFNAIVTIIEPNKIKISSTSVNQPIAVRYCWSNCPINGKVFNSDNLPLAPFRTDEWSISTQGVN